MEINNQTGQIMCFALPGNLDVEGPDMLCYFIAVVSVRWNDIFNDQVAAFAAGELGLGIAGHRAGKHKI